MSVRWGRFRTVVLTVVAAVLAAHGYSTLASGDVPTSSDAPIVVESSTHSL